MSASVSRPRLIINVVAFQIGWFAAVLGGAHDRPMLGCGIALLVMLLHLFMSQRPVVELRLLLSVTLIGSIWDTALMHFNVIDYPHGQLIPQLAPLWIVALWGLFSTTLNVSLRFLKRRYLVAALFGVVGAPLSFLAGERLQALRFPNTLLALVVLGIGWGLIMMLLMWLSQHMDGVSEASEP